MFFEPRSGWRHVEVAARRTKQDFAQCMQQLVDGYDPEAEAIRIVLDNLNTHTPAALYETFHPAEAHRLLQRLEFHYTPKHGSWLNMVEIEFSVLAHHLFQLTATERVGYHRTARQMISRSNWLPLKSIMPLLLNLTIRRVA